MGLGILGKLSTTALGRVNLSAPFLLLLTLENKQAVEGRVVQVLEGGAIYIDQSVLCCMSRFGDFYPFSILIVESFNQLLEAP